MRSYAHELEAHMVALEPSLLRVCTFLNASFNLIECQPGNFVRIFIPRLNIDPKDPFGPHGLSMPLLSLLASLFSSTPTL